MRRALPLVLPVLATLLPAAALAQNKPAPLDAPAASTGSPTRSPTGSPTGSSGAERVPDLPGKPPALSSSRASRPPPARVQDTPRATRPSRQPPAAQGIPNAPAVTAPPVSTPPGAAPASKPAPAPGPGEREA